MRVLTCLAPGVPASLFETLAGLLGGDLEFDLERSGPDRSDDPFRDGRADVGWICSTSFALLGTGPDPSVRMVGVGWVPDDPDVAGRSVYFGDLVVSPDSPVRSFDDLAGARIGGNDAVSLSGHHALRFELRHRRLDPGGFADIVLTGGHHRSLDLLTAGELDAAVVDSVVRRSRARTDPAVEALRVVQRLGPWPTQPLVAATSVPDDVVREVRDALLAANDDPVVREQLRIAALAELVEVPDDHCRPVIEAMHRA